MSTVRTMRNRSRIHGEKQDKQRKLLKLITRPKGSTNMCESTVREAIRN